GEVVGVFPKLDPENAVEIGILDVRVMGELLGEGGLAVAAGAAQRRGDGDGIPFGIQEVSLQSVELNGSLHEIVWRLRRHHADALLPALALQDPDQRRDVLWQIEIVDLAKPAWQLAEIAKSWPFDGTDRLALLTRQPNLPPNDRARQGRRGDDENRMLQNL